ncbi:MAG TPA: M15 family metallopeptidase [Chryseosolibacter sp.]|nr:M15 family metallopeptidase [Chryseosolibacter sp.]
MKKKFLLSALCLAVGVGVSAIVTDTKGQRYSGFTFITYTPFPDTTAILEDESDSISYDSIEAFEPENIWRSWKTVENHSFGKDRGNIPMIADLQSLHPYFRDKITLLIRNCRAKGIELAVVESYRTHAKQSEYYTMGRKYTRTPGGKSKHQYGLAVDVVPMVNNIPQWDNTTLWRKVGTEGEKLGLRWGGRWKSPYDPAHFEWSGGLTTSQLATGALPKVPYAATANYPCIHDDVKELRSHWHKWETEQKLLKNKATPSMASTRSLKSTSQVNHAK